MTRCLEIRRDDLRSTRVVEEPLPDLGAGQALLRIERFGLTSNNVTYGATGDALGYWRFFPADDGWGRIPVWGFATVERSEARGLDVGDRVFGYLPMATHLVVEPSHASPHGFTDGAAHRVELPAVYNRYQRTDADPLYRPDTEGLQAVFVPLFVTSFVLDDFLADNDDFGAAQIVLSSASSKTAAGTALCLTRRSGDRPEVVGLTSASHVEFVTGLGCYDRVISYAEVDTLDVVPSVFVDVAGDDDIRRSVHQHLGEALRHSSAVGAAHWEASRSSHSLPGPRPVFFFAPTQIAKRLTDWGPFGYQQRLAEAWRGLLDSAADWVRLVDVEGFDGLEDAYLRLVDGTVSPDEAFFVSIEPEDPASRI